MILRVFNIIKTTKVEGPGVRYCIWVQGCSKHCKGCQAVHTWSFDGGIIYNTKNIIEDILSYKDRIEGITFLGGEPFEQADALGEIAQAVKNEGLSVLCFTGNLIEELYLHKKNQKLLDNTDLLIDGAFEIDKLDYSRPWCGSSNQRYHFLTDFYDESTITKYKNKLEINISKNGMVFINGMGDFDDVLHKIDFVPVKC